MALIEEMLMMTCRRKENRCIFSPQRIQEPEAQASNFGPAVLYRLLAKGRATTVYMPECIRQHQYILRIGTSLSSRSENESSKLEASTRHDWLSYTTGVRMLSIILPILEANGERQTQFSLLCPPRHAAETWRCRTSRNKMQMG